MEQDEDLYEILGVDRDASQQDVRAACRRLLSQVHPDHGGSDALFRVVYRAYFVLNDPERRAAYDESLRSRAAAGRAEPQAVTEDEELLEGWLPPEPPAERAQPPAWSSLSTRAKSTTFVTYHPSLAAFVTAVLLAVAASLSQERGLVSFSLVAVVIALVGHAGHRRALSAEQARLARLADVDAMSPEEFVDHLVGIFRREGFAVRHVKSADEVGAAFLLRRDGVTTVARARQWVSSEETELIGSVASIRARLGVDRALVVTNAPFGPEEIELAGRHGVELIGRTELTTLMASQAALPPARGADLFGRELQHGIPAVLGMLRASLVAVVSLVDAMAGAWEGTAAPAHEVPMREPSPPREEAAAG